MSDATRLPPARTIIGADWAGTPRGRAVCVARVSERRALVSARTDWTLAALLQRAQREQPPVWIAIDAALGVPRGVFPEADVHGFVPWLREAARAERFFDPVATSRSWRRERPFFRVEPGPGGLRRYEARAGKLLRDVDRATGGKPLFAVSGIPGSVGSATRDSTRFSAR